MNYQISQDIKSIRAILGLTQSALADKIGMERVTISRAELGKTDPSDKLLECIYEFAFDKKIQLNLLKEMFWTESLDPSHKLLFHGAKDIIHGPLSPCAGRSNNDFGQGFYAGESYEQAISFVSGFERSSVYYIDFDDRGLTKKTYTVDQDWLLTIAYFRGALDKYKEHPSIKKLALQARDCDYIIAPIADNRMFQIINSFIEGEITDEQCRHCLAATNLGSQYVFLTEKALRQVNVVERCYISKKEKAHYKNKRSSDMKLGDDKVKLARIQYRGQGRYIDEIL